ncbi:hypothetical protein Tph_c28920 [Thermacetogenium phaeum DSM 12270]|uniref:Uncharacterized protein n=1 Tax=Thermacetogenium phaeum (strain ATCC BAA-254 / DSM 26808 / PB) TaxID=1089553 RepID=K4LLS5_THEPS|nr:hypothetical protein Tph_c28920 [Thermacetogenium phaeum DSM 12270]
MTDAASIAWRRGDLLIWSAGWGIIHLRLLDLVQGFVYTQRKIRRAILLALGTAFRKWNFF